MILFAADSEKLGGRARIGIPGGAGGPALGSGDKDYWVLLRHILRRAHSGNVSRNLARLGSKDHVAGGIGQNRRPYLGIRKGAGCILEAAGSASDLQG